jgi:glycosyltransferase involved in cell wall biosynthesis
LSGRAAHIGLDARTLYSKEVRGIGSYVNQLAGRLPGMCEHRLTLYFETARWGKPVLDSPRLQERQVRMRGSRFFLWEQVGLPVAIARDRLDLFHSTANTLPLLQPCPFVLSLHDVLLLHMMDDETPRVAFYWRRVLPRAIRRAAKIITISNYSRDDIVASLGVRPDRIVVIPLAVDSAFRPLSMEEVRSGTPNLPQPGFVLVLGAEAPRKNTARALEAFARLKRQGFPDTKLVVSGLSPRLGARMRGLGRQLGISGDLETLGFVSQEHLRLLYGRARVFLYPSTFEGFGLPVLEAMACGTAVVASNRTSIPEVAGDAAILCDPDDPDGIAQALATVLSRPGVAADYRARGLKRAGQASWDASIKRTLQVYEEVLRGSRRAKEPME